MRRPVILIVVLSTISTLYAAEVRLLDLEPNDAQQIIDQQDTSLKYAPKIESNVPAVRYLGNEPHNVLEDIYLANQYHGQDGIGGYLYGYSVPDIAKTERKKPSGDLKGAYNYIAGNGQEIKVEYWDDGTGFHQIDNVPKILPKQIDDTPEVKAAKEEHARIWQEQAERNSHPIANPYNPAGQYASGPLSAQGQLQRQQQFSQQLQYKPGQYQLNQVSRLQGQGQFFPAAQGSAPQGQLGAGVSAQYNPGSQAQYNAIPQGQPGQYNAGAQGQYNPGSQGQYKVGGQGQQYQGQSTQTVSQYQAKPVVPQSQDKNDVYSGQNTENRASFAPAQQKPVAYQQSATSAQGQYQQGPSHQQQQAGQYQQGQYQQPAGQYQQSEGDNDDGSYHPGPNEDGEGVTGPPKGFFYSFDYPVGIIVSKDGGPVKREGELKDIYAQNKAHFEDQLKGQGSAQGGSYLVQQ